MHDPRIGRFFAVDPLASKYPHNSTYAFSENEVVAFVELEGLEKKPSDSNSSKAKLVPIAVTAALTTETAATVSVSSVAGTSALVLAIPAIGLGLQYYFDPWGVKPRLEREAAELEYWRSVEPSSNPQPTALLEPAPAPLETLFPKNETHTESDALSLPQPKLEPLGPNIDDNDDDGGYEYFYRAMSLNEFKETGGLLQHKKDNSGKYNGAGPFVTTEKSYLTNDKAFISKGKNLKKYDIIVTYKVEKNTEKYLDAVSLIHPQGNITKNAINQFVPVRKSEKGVKNFGFPGKSGNLHFNPKIKSISTESIKKP